MDDVLNFSEGDPSRGAINSTGNWSFIIIIVFIFLIIFCFSNNGCN